mmetsp:Transcript_19306/g.35560  ORF Transcript_19306/g.35560 Transcript_19306/m.35560 type:complete len:322 (-) Transcript_19306:5435-6400(-)
MEAVMVDSITFDLSSDCEPLAISTIAFKRTSGWIKRWQPRLLTLADRKLTYRRSQNDQPRILDFDFITAKVNYLDNIVEIQPLLGRRSFVFKFKNHKTAGEWAACLKSHIEISRGKMRELPHFVKQKNYWRYSYVSELDFLRLANTGDIILFRGCNSLAKLQRAFTRSEYDHVAMIMRFYTGEVAFFEAIQGEGVTMVKWEEFKQHNWHKLYSRIAYRQLSIDRSEATLQKLQDFIDRVIGLRYKLTIAKLCGSRPSRLASREVNYFCSELMAASFQEMGLLPDTLKPGQYLPGDFSAKRQLPLINGAQLGPELLIDLEQD